MEKFILKRDECIDLDGISYEDFIKLHQFLEDSGNRMYQSTKHREGRSFNFSSNRYLLLNDGGEVCGGYGSRKKVKSYIDVLTKTYSINYEIY